MKNTDFMNLSLPEGTDKIDVEILNNDFKKLESEASKHYIKQQIEVDGTATIIGSIGPYVQLENLTDNILNVRIGDELVILMKGDNRKIRTISGENYGVVTSGAVRITYYINAQTYADENFYKKEKVDELLQNVEATVEVDAELSETSENPVQNKVITAEFANYATTAEVESKVTEKVAEIVSGAPEDFDTLKEMSDWLTEHEDSAATMNSAIQKNTEDIATANTNIQKNVDDITAVKNSVAINKTTLGTQRKNLLKPPTKNQTINGISYIINDDGTITATGTASKSSIFLLYTIKKDGKYKISGCPSTGSTTTYMLTVATEKQDGTVTYSVDKGSGVNVTFNSALHTQITISIEIKVGITVEDIVFSPMLRYADITDDTYEPYVPSINEQISPTVKSVIELYNSCGVKNKIKIKSGVVKYGDFTLTANSDGTVKVSPGTTTTLINMTASESWKTLTKITIPAGNYYFESNVESGVSSDIRKADGTVTCSNKNTCTITEETELYLNIRINANTTVSEEVILKPLFMLSYIKDKTYVPYIPTNTDLQEQINTLLARIAALEGTATTTEGGE